MFRGPPGFEAKGRHTRMLDRVKHQGPAAPENMGDVSSTGIWQRSGLKWDSRELGRAVRMQKPKPAARRKDICSTKGWHSFEFFSHLKMLKKIITCEPRRRALWLNDPFHCPLQSSPAISFQQEEKAGSYLTLGLWVKSSEVLETSSSEASSPFDNVKSQSTAPLLSRQAILSDCKLRKTEPPDMSSARNPVVSPHCGSDEDLSGGENFCSSFTLLTQPCILCLPLDGDFISSMPFDVFIFPSSEDTQHLTHSHLSLSE